MKEKNLKNKLKLGFHSTSHY